MVSYSVLFSYVFIIGLVPAILAVEPDDANVQPQVPESEFLKGIDANGNLDQPLRFIDLGVSLVPVNAQGNEFPFCLTLAARVWFDENEFQQLGDLQDIVAVVDALRSKLLKRYTYSGSDHQKLKLVSLLAALALAGNTKVYDNGLSNAEDKFIKLLVPDAFLGLNSLDQFEKLKLDTPELKLWLRQETCPVALTDVQVLLHDGKLQVGDYANDIAAAVDALKDNEAGEVNAGGDTSVETSYLDSFEKLDKRDYPNERLYPVTLKLHFHPLHVKDENIKFFDLQSTTSVLLPLQKLQQCAENNYNLCFAALRDVLFDRATHVSARPFKSGVLATLLDALVLQGRVYIETFNINADASTDAGSEISIWAPEYFTLIKNPNFFRECYVNATSQDGLVFLKTGTLDGEFNVPEGAQLVDLGVSYPPAKYEVKLLKEYYPDLAEVAGLEGEQLDQLAAEYLPQDSQLQPETESTPGDSQADTAVAGPSNVYPDAAGETSGDTPTLHRKATGKTGGPPVSDSEDSYTGETRGFKREDLLGGNVGGVLGEGVDQAPKQRLPTPRAARDLAPENAHLVVSAIERSLLQVPKKLTGYRLNWTDIERFPEIQDLWQTALIAMKIQKEDEKLRDVLDRRQFTYDELKNLFEITYGLIAANNYEGLKQFYDSAHIPREAVETNLTRVRGIFQATTGTYITRLPPLVKPMANTCPVTNLITTLTTNDLIGRLQILLADWLEPLALTDGANTQSDELAILCSATAVFVQQWRFLQLAQGFKEDGVAWGILIQAFSHMAKGNYANPAVKKRLKKLINSATAKKCRKYISQAGIVASSPYKGTSRNIDATSLLGAVGNALGINMESKPDDVATNLQAYVTAASNKNTLGNALGLCLSLQLLDRLHRCFNVEKSSDFGLYKLGLLTADTGPILDAYTSNLDQHQIGGGANALNTMLVHKACNSKDPLVEATVEKLIKVASIDAHEQLIAVLQKRTYSAPNVDENGAVHDTLDLDSDALFDDDDFIELSDTGAVKYSGSQLDYGSDMDRLLDDDESTTSNTTSGTSFLELASRFEDLGAQQLNVEKYEFPHVHDNSINASSQDHEHLKQYLCKGGVCKMQQAKDGKVNSELWQANHLLKLVKLLGNEGALHDDTKLREVLFDVRMSPLGIGALKHEHRLKCVSVPVNFHQLEAPALRQLDGKALFDILLHRLQKRVDTIKHSLPNQENLRRIKHMALLRNQTAGEIIVDEKVVHANRDLETYENLIKILEGLPDDGFYFEYPNGTGIPSRDVGNQVANVLLKPSGKWTLVLQVIDPVQDLHVEDLKLGSKYVKQHDHHYYRHISL